MLFGLLLYVNICGGKCCVVSNCENSTHFCSLPKLGRHFFSVQAEEVFAEPMFESTLYTLAVIVACIKDKDLFCSNQEETKKKEGMVLV